MAGSSRSTPFPVPVYIYRSFYRSKIYRYQYRYRYRYSGFRGFSVLKLIWFNSRNNCSTGDKVKYRSICLSVMTLIYDLSCKNSTRKDTCLHRDFLKAVMPDLRSCLKSGIIRIQHGSFTRRGRPAPETMDSTATTYSHTCMANNTAVDLQYSASIMITGRSPYNRYFVSQQQKPWMI